MRSIPRRLASYTLHLTGKGNVRAHCCLLAFAVSFVRRILLRRSPYSALPYCWKKYAESSCSHKNASWLRPVQGTTCKGNPCESHPVVGTVVRSLTLTTTMLVRSNLPGLQELRAPRENMCVRSGTGTKHVCVFSDAEWQIRWP